MSVQMTSADLSGTFGGVDFLHSVLGEVSDHVTQSEVNESEVSQLNSALTNAAASQNRGPGDSESRASVLTDVLANIPGTSGLAREAIDLQRSSDQQAMENSRSEQSRGADSSYVPYGDEYNSTRASASGATNTGSSGFAAPPGSQGGPPGPGIPGVNANIDPQAVIAKIYPILAFRDKVVRAISGIVSKIPGLEKMIETISEKVTLFVMGLLAPFVKPVIAAASNALKTGSGTVVSASAKQQYLVWSDPTSSDPTHSMLSKDHFSNVLNAPAGQVAAAILQYVAPRVIYGWEHPEVPESEILNDIGHCFHHPAIRDHNLEIHRTMFNVVEKWSRSRPIGGRDLNDVLSSDSVKAGKNHVVQDLSPSLQPLSQNIQQGLGGGTTSHSHTSGGPFSMLSQLTQSRELPSESGLAYGGGQQPEYQQSSEPYGQHQSQHGYGGGYGQPEQPRYEQQHGGGYGGYGGQEQQGYGERYDRY